MDETREGSALRGQLQQGLARQHEHERVLAGFIGARDRAALHDGGQRKHVARLESDGALGRRGRRRPG